MLPVCMGRSASVTGACKAPGYAPGHANRRLPRLPVLPPLLRVARSVALARPRSPAAARRGPDRYTDVWVPKALRGSKPRRRPRSTRSDAHGRARPAGAHPAGDARLRALQRSAARRGAREPRAGVRADAPLGDRQAALARARGPGAADRLRRGRPRSAIDSVFRRARVARPCRRRRRRHSCARRSSTRSSSSRASTSPRATPRWSRRPTALGIPTGIVVYSWDNLSSKGLVHVRPDRAVRLERGPGGGGRGAARDPARPGRRHRRRPLRLDLRALALRGRARSSCAELGLDPARKTVLYLGSSAFVAPREPEFVERWARRGARRGLNVLVRPHPGTAGDEAWTQWRAPGGVVVAPAGRP